MTRLLLPPLLLVWLLPSVLPAAPDDPSLRIREKGTGLPVAGAEAYVRETGDECAADADGLCPFAGLAPGRYTLIVAATGYARLERTLELETDRPAEVFVEPVIAAGLEVVVRGRREREEVSVQTLRPQELTVIPGSRGDPIKVIQNLPGVANEGQFGSPTGLIIRGSNPESSAVWADGHVLPILYHFGSIKSVINADLLERITLYAGGFGVEHGNSTGGVVEVTTRPPESRAWRGYVDTSLLDATLFVEGPLGKNDAIAASVRRSTIDIILPAVMPDDLDFSFTTYPRYYDYQVKYRHTWRKGSVDLFSYGSDDATALLSDLTTDHAPDITGRVRMELAFHKTGLTVTHRNGPLELVFAPAYTWIGSRVDMGDKYYFDTTLGGVSLRTDGRIEFSDTNSLAFGFSLVPQWGRLDSTMIRPPKEGDPWISFANDEKIESRILDRTIELAAYVKEVIKTGRLTLIPGLRVDYTGHIDDASIDPRLLFRVDATEALTVKGAVGLYHESPLPDEMYEPYGTPDLSRESSLHAVAGVEYRFGGLLTIDLQGYYKHLWDQVVPARAPGAGRPYTNDGTGRIYGVELLIRHNPTDRLFGWLSYSFSRSQRKDGPDEPWRLFDFDQTHNLVATATYRFDRGWSVGGRFQLTTGKPYSSPSGAVKNLDNGTHIPIFLSQNLNAKRLPLWHRLDLRVDKKWLFDTWSLNLYLDVQGVYYHKNAAVYVYNYDFTELFPVYELPILPALGLKAEF